MVCVEERCSCTDGPFTVHGAYTNGTFAPSDEYSLFTAAGYSFCHICSLEILTDYGWCMFVLFNGDPLFFVIPVIDHIGCSVIRYFQRPYGARLR